ncbi:MAG: S8 family peptidase [Bacteroidales bacterium]|nr:S8 family peptidase [Bacteroidales bacterium]
MKRTLLIALCISTLIQLSAQERKCGIDTRALVAEEIAAGATSVRMLAKMAPGFDRGPFEKAGIVFGTQAGQIVTLTVPVETLGMLESSPEVQQYSISHRIAAPMMNLARGDTRTDSVQAGLGTSSGLPYTGKGVYIGITDWGFDYTHPNFNNLTPDNMRVDMAWDHFRQAGPAPAGFNYGTLISGTEALHQAQGDTSNLYGYGTHGTHVAGICAGRGANGQHIGQAPDARLLFCTFLLSEAEWMDGVAWMRQVAQDSARRLVVNSSWGMYSFSTLDGTSLLSQAIDNWSDEGTVFVTSAGNNGYSFAPFHISRTFTPGTVDTLRTVVGKASSIYQLQEVGQVLILWGDEQGDFSARLRFKTGSQVWSTPSFNTADGDTVIYDTIVCGYSATIPYRVLVEHRNPFDHRPHIQINVAKTNLQTHLLFTAESGQVHAWNLVDMENNAGNSGCPFSSNYMAGYSNGDSDYGISEPACASKCISVAAHKSDRWNANYTVYTTGDLTDFSSHGPLINGRVKPDISAPGSDVISSISSFTTDGGYATKATLTTSDGKVYKWSNMSGTSMSSPAATGVVALLLEANPDLTVDQIRDILFTTARNDSKTGPLAANDSVDTRWGHGKIDALAAVNKALTLVGIQQVEQRRTPVQVFPNPATAQVTVHTGCGERQLLEVYSASGTLMVQTPVSIETTLDVSRWPKGVYIVRTGSRTAKLVVK